MAEPKKLGKVLFIDAYDSFSENIAAMLSQTLSVQVFMIHIDTDIKSLFKKFVPVEQRTLTNLLKNFDAVVLGPGPGNPISLKDVGLFSNIWKLEGDDVKPVLGICLGFQSLCVNHGASVSPLPLPCHGHAKDVLHCADDIFNNVGAVFATNYHSLEIKLPTNTTYNDNQTASFPHTTMQLPLRPLAWDAAQTLMAARHVELPYWGLQFHPESCKSSKSCQTILRNWWQASSRWMMNRSPQPPFFLNPLPSGHAWSRPLTPISHPTEFAGREGSNVEDQSIYEHLARLTTSSRAAVQTESFEVAHQGSTIAALCKRVSRGDCVMLESTRKGRYSVYAFPSPGRCRLEYSLESSTCVVHDADQRPKTWRMDVAVLFAQITKLMDDRKAAGGEPALPFWGGFLGYFSYEVGLETVDVTSANRQTCPAFPDVSLLWVERCIVLDHVEQKAYVQSLCADDSAWLWQIAYQLQLGACYSGYLQTDAASQQILLQAAKTTLPDEEEYKRKIRSCQAYLHAGDSYELCLTTEAQVTVPVHRESAWLIYSNLRQHNPVPFSAFLSLGDTSILSSSPEEFMSWDRSTGGISMIPMKGTVAKSPDMTLERAKEILASPKESAENLMIADLIRHDLYSTVGWHAYVDVVRLCEVVEHETVFQLVSHIKATPPLTPVISPESSSSSCTTPSLPTNSTFDSASTPYTSPGSSSSPVFNDKTSRIIHYGHKALRQALPPGSMTGAPKKRSCEILDNLEQRRRGPYSGVIGYLDVGGGGGFSVCIRTAMSHTAENEYGAVSGGEGLETRRPVDNNRIEKAPSTGRQKWRVGAGGAITVLSNPEGEWSEMKTKLNSVLRAFTPEE